MTILIVQGLNWAPDYSWRLKMVILPIYINNYYDDLVILCTLNTYGSASHVTEIPPSYDLRIKGLPTYLLVRQPVLGPTNWRAALRRAAQRVKLLAAFNRRETEREIWGCRADRADESIVRRPASSSFQAQNNGGVSVVQPRLLLQRRCVSSSSSSPSSLTYSDPFPPENRDFVRGQLFHEISISMT